LGEYCVTDEVYKYDDGGHVHYNKRFIMRRILFADDRRTAPARGYILSLVVMRQCLITFLLHATSRIYSAAASFSSSS